MAVAWRVVDPVEGDERQASEHENNSHNQEDHRLERKETRTAFSVRGSTAGSGRTSSLSSMSAPLKGDTMRTQPPVYRSAHSP